MKTKNIYYLSNITTLICNFISFDDTLSLIEELKSSKKMNDLDIIKFMELHRKKNFRKDSLFSPEIKSNQELYGLQNLTNIIKKYIKKNNNPSYIDLCCGDGRKTVLISKMLNIKDENIHGTDIKIWGPYKKNRNLPFNFKFILDNCSLDYPDNSFDIMSCILSLHHIENLTNILSEIKRVLKPNGIFILTEHDNYTHYDAMIIEIQHTLFSFFYDNNKDYIKNPLYSRYFNSMEWEFIMDKNGFKLLSSGTYINNISESKRYDQQFYSIYKNNNKK
jgi:ubiquinone/menaquinone biosynthesis C-methylase UbiE